MSDQEQRTSRSWRNLLLRTNDQFRPALLSVLLGMAFTVGLTLLVNWEASHLSARNLSPHGEICVDCMDRQVLILTLTVVVGVLLFTACNFVVFIVWTHRLFGPEVAFRRHIRALIHGDYQVRTKLRPRDLFIDVASDLNELSEKLSLSK